MNATNYIINVLNTY